MRVPDLHDLIVRGILARRHAEGGFAASRGGPSEVEPTAVAALALRDRVASAWLTARQKAGGGFAEPDGRDVGPATAALAALALADRDAARRALRAAVGARGLPPPHLPQDERMGWGWTGDTRSLVEPTARILVATKRLAPSDGATRSEAVRLLEARRCADGGWNYGNVSHLDVDLRSYAQTTAFALIALVGERATLVRPGLEFLRTAWPEEPGVLTTAQSLVAFRLYGLESQGAAAADAIRRMSSRATFFDRPTAAAWAALATGSDASLDVLRGAP